MHRSRREPGRSAAASRGHANHRSSSNPAAHERPRPHPHPRARRDLRPDRMRRGRRHRSSQAGSSCRSSVTDGGAARPLVAGTKIRLSFTADGIGARQVATRWAARYRIEGGRLFVDGVATTEMGCDAGATRPGRVAQPAPRLGARDPPGRRTTSRSTAARSRSPSTIARSPSPTRSSSARRGRSSRSSAGDARLERPAPSPSRRSSSRTTARSRSTPAATVAPGRGRPLAAGSRSGR